MARVRPPWRALRPILLAGAVTATWLTLSTSAATADSSADSSSLPGGVTSSISSLPAPLTAAVIHQPEPAAPAGHGLVQPDGASVAGLADQLIAAIPVVNSAVPQGTMTAVVVPVAEVADSAAGSSLVEAVAPPLAEALPVLDPVLQPVVELVDATVPLLPVSLPDQQISEVPLADVVADAAPAAVETTTGAMLPVNAASISNADTARPVPAATGTSSAPGVNSSDIRSAAPGSPWTGDPSSPPAPAPAGPASGAGSGAPPSGPSGAPAWLNNFRFNLPLPGSFPVALSPQHAPSPASFDPGSSPD